ncbi:pilus assembly FimT family protein, partial [Roseateles sp. P5_E11]
MKARISGVTLIEILVGLGVMGVILAVAVPSMADLLERRRVTAATEEVAGVLNYAKAETNAIDALLFVRFDPDTVNPTSSKVSCALVATAEGLNKCRCYLPANDLCPGTNQRPLRLFQLPQTYVKFDAFATSWGAGPNYIRFQRQQNTLATEGFQVDVAGLGKGYTLRV